MVFADGPIGIGIYFSGHHHGLRYAPPSCLHTAFHGLSAAHWFVAISREVRKTRLLPSHFIALHQSGSVADGADIARDVGMVWTEQELMYLEPILPSMNSIVGIASHFSAGQTVFRQGDGGTDVFEVLLGLVMTGRDLANGVRRISAFHGRGDAFGFDTCGTRSQFADAVSDCTIARYHRPAPDRYVRRPFPGPLLAQTLSSIARTRRHTLVLQRRSALARVAAFLVDGLERSDIASVIDLPMTRSNVASYLGLAVSTVTAALGRMEREGVIEMPTPSQIRVLDLLELRRLDG